MVGVGLLKPNYRWHIWRVCIWLSLWFGFWLLPPHPGDQAPIAKILLGVFGVAAVVVLIAVPTAIFLRGKSIVLCVCMHHLKHIRLKERGDKSTHASLRTIGLDSLRVAPLLNQTSEARTNNLSALSRVEERDSNWITSPQPSTTITTLHDDGWRRVYDSVSYLQRVTFNASSPFRMTQRTTGTTRGLSPWRTSSTVPWNQRGTASGGSQVGLSGLNTGTAACGGARAADALWSVSGLLIHWDLFHNAIVCAITRGWEVCIPVL